MSTILILKVTVNGYEREKKTFNYITIIHVKNSKYAVVDYCTFRRVTKLVETKLK